MEETKRSAFDGFAIGGIADTRGKESHAWGVPTGAKQDLKSMIVSSNVVKRVRARLTEAGDERPIHVLGAGSHINAIPLIYAGADSFDCHSGWRRANDGSDASCSQVHQSAPFGEMSKMLLPLFRNVGKITNDPDGNLDFKRINELASADMDCECPVCQQYPVDRIKKIYSRRGEDHYFAKMLIYSHALYQMRFIIETIKNKSPDELESYISGLPRIPLKVPLEKSIAVLKSL